MSLRVESRYLLILILPFLFIMNLGCWPPYIPDKYDSLTITAPDSVTAGLTGYQASVPDQGNATYNWTVLNADIVAGDNTRSITFKVRPNANNEVILSCTATLQSGPSLMGSESVPVYSGPFINLDDRKEELRHGTETATTAAVPGMTYLWSMTGGEIVGGQGTPTMTYYNAPLAMATPLARTPADSSELAITLTETDALGTRATFKVTFHEFSLDTVAPSGLAYDTVDATFTVGQAIPMMLQHSGGGSVTTYTVAPDLPAGLTLDPASGFIYGTPKAAAARADYTVSATNALGSAAETLTLTVNDTAPSKLDYSYTTMAFTLGTPITPDLPASAGGAVAKYTVSPALPQGLALDPGTGILSGTPTALTAQKTYTVTAANSGGHDTVDLSLTVNDAPPSNLGYTYTTQAFTLNAPIADDHPSSGGGAVVSYSVSPDLPPGLALDPRTGVLSGTPTALATQKNYTVTATNTGGSAEAELMLTVNDASPLGLTYTYTTRAFTLNTPIPADQPSIGGGAVVDYSVSPALPAGLALDPRTGVLSGTPTALTPRKTYTVKAANTGGYAIVDLKLTVNDAAPSNLNYTYTTQTFSLNAPITADQPTSGGGAVVNYSVSPALPAGLALDPATGVLSGTPTAVTVQKTYTVTATNTGGSDTVDLILQVAASIAFTSQPSDVTTFSGRRATFTVGATGAGALNYQWLKNGSPISGATSATYVTPVLALADDGAQYSVQVSNPGGSPVPSSSATLTVVQAVPRFAYVANRADHTLSLYTVNAATGQLRANGYIFTGTTPSAVAVDPSEQFVFVTNKGDDTVSSFVMDPSSGALTAVSTPATGGGPSALATDPSGTRLYVTNSYANTVSTYTIANDGTLTSLGAAVPTGNDPEAIAVDASGRFACVLNKVDSTVQAYTVGADGSLHANGSPLPAGLAAKALAISPAGSFVCVAGNGSLFVIPVDPATGSLGAAAGHPVGSDLTGVAFDPTGAYLFATDTGLGAGQVAYALGFDASSGALTPMGQATLLGALGPVAVDPSGAFVYAVDSGLGEVTVCSWNPAAAPSLRTYRGILSHPGSDSIALSIGAAPVTYYPGFVYVAEEPASPNPGYVSGFSLNPTSGALGPIPFGMPVTSGSANTTTWVSTDPAGRFAYATNFDDGTLSSYTIDGGLGGLTPSGTVSTDTHPGATVVDPSGRFLFSTAGILGSSVIDAFRIGTGGTLTSLASTSTVSVPITLAMDPTGRFLFTVGRSGLEAFTVDPVSGALASITQATPANSSFGPGTVPVQMAVNPTGNFIYVASTTPAGGAGIDTFSFNPVSGMPNLIPTPLVLSAPQPNVSGIAVDPAGTYAYLTLNPGSSSTGALQVLSLDGITGLPTAVGSPLATSYQGAQNPVVDPSGAFLLFPDTSGHYSTYALDPVTGLPTLIQDLLDFALPPLSGSSAPQALAVTTRIQ